MATSGNPEIALSMSPVAFGLAGKKVKQKDANVLREAPCKELSKQLYV